MGDFKITRRSLEALKAKGAKDGTRYADTSLPGFCVTTYGTGKIAFSVRYRVNGQRRSVKVGDWPSTTPEDARKAALAVLGGAAKGEDEAANRKAAREAAEGKARRITFASWRAAYLKDAVRRMKSTRDVERYLAMAGEEWDQRPVADIQTADVEKFRDKLAERTNRGGRKATTQANRWTTCMHAAFASAVRLGHVERNIVSNVQLLRENDPRQRVMTPDEEKRLREAIATWPNPFEKAAFMLLVDTGCRLSEALKAKWEDFTLDEKTHEGTWRIPSPKTGRPQAIPILAHVGAVIAKTPKLVDAPFVVTGKIAMIHRKDLKKPWTRLREAAKVPADLHIHDLRRSFGLRVTLAQGIFAASKLLRHSNSGVTERVYSPLSAENVRAYAEGTEEARLLAFKPKQATKAKGAARSAR